MDAPEVGGPRDALQLEVATLRSRNAVLEAQIVQALKDLREVREALVRMHRVAIPDPPEGWGKAPPAWMGILLVLLVGCTKARGQADRPPWVPPVARLPIMVAQEGGDFSDVQEGLDAAADHGRDLYVCGGAGGPVYHLAKTLRFPPLQDFRMDGGNYVLNYEGPADEPAIEIDSMMNCDIRMGLLAYGGKDAAVRISPRGPVPIDGFPIFTETRLYFETVCNDSPWMGVDHGATGVLLDGSTAPIVANRFEFTAVLNFRRNVVTKGDVRCNDFGLSHLHSNVSGSYLFVAGEGFEKNWARFVLGMDQGATGIHPPVIPAGNKIETAWR